VRESVCERDEEEEDVSSCSSPAPRHGRFVWLLVGTDVWSDGAEDDVLAKIGRMSSSIAASVVRAHERVIDAMVLQRGFFETYTGIWK